MANQQEFDPWGKVRLGGMSQTTLNYTAQRLDGTGLLYYHARYYDPVVGKFISPDTVIPRLLDPQKFNRYTYVSNKPLNLSDPTGHRPEDPDDKQKKVAKTIDELEASKAGLSDAEATMVNQNIELIKGLVKDNGIDTALAFIEFMDKIQAGTIMNYSSEDILPWDQHTAIGVSRGMMVEAPQMGIPVRYLSAAGIWSNGNYKKQYVTLYEVPGITDRQRGLAADFARSQLGKPYQWPGADVSDSNDTWYCTKLALGSLEAAGVQFYEYHTDHAGWYPWTQTAGRTLNPWDVPNLGAYNPETKSVEFLKVSWSSF
jgi:RHS repeat-associated protein